MRASLRRLLNLLLRRGSTLGWGLTLAPFDWLGSAAGHVPGGPGGLSAALLELFAVGLAFDLMAGSSALGEGRPTLFLRLRLLGPDGLRGELAPLREHGGDLLSDVLLGEGSVVRAREAGAPVRAATAGRISVWSASGRAR
ncbi:hypothetical protein ACGF07_25760 [Kitasatospora sp. NPDC048194]|uniref:hypothetical protein n=1 Tax=Kitasatospora sp. NPDC048194 TaxID=3364045 RepID=UPI0037238BE0